MFTMEPQHTITSTASNGGIHCALRHGRTGLEEVWVYHRYCPQACFCSRPARTGSNTSMIDHHRCLLQALPGCAGAPSLLEQIAARHTEQMLLLPLLLMMTMMLAAKTMAPVHVIAMHKRVVVPQLGGQSHSASRPGAVSYAKQGQGGRLINGLAGKSRGTACKAKGASIVINVHNAGNAHDRDCWNFQTSGMTYNRRDLTTPFTLDIDTASALLLVLLVRASSWQR